MEIIRKLSDLGMISGSVVSIGNFDGVHLGHRVLLDRLVTLAREKSVPSIVFTFDPHPLEILNPEKFPPRILTLERKAELLKRQGVDLLIACPTTPLMLQMSYIEFFDQVVCQSLKARGMVEGPNFQFGKNREGNVERLSELGKKRGVEVQIVEIQQAESQVVSSSLIRQLISSGQIENANDLLGDPFEIEGIVEHGSKRGTEIGFPTANLEQIKTMIPANGVYAGRTIINQRKNMAAINIGPNPTFGDQRQKVEVHLLGADVDLYGDSLQVRFLKRIRDIRKFGSQSELTKQIENDVAEIREIVC